MTLGLSSRQNSTMEATMAHIEPKDIRQFIMPSESPTDMIHKATLITMALLPVYNHVFMALMVEPQHTIELYREV